MPCLSPVWTPDMRHNWPCGRCIGCLEKYSRDWTQRMLDEFKLNNNVGCMLTLTYDNEHLPEDGNLHKDDFQRFMKRLRKSISPVKVRYFMSGEYGGKYGRCHFHCVLFGWIPSDLKRVGYKDYYKSDLVSKIWKNGFVNVILDLNEISLRYSAKYLNKLKSHWKDVSPYTAMSRKPGIGAFAVTPEMLLTGDRWLNGKRYFVPRYYLDQLDKQGYNTSMIRKARSAFLASFPVGKDERSDAILRYKTSLLCSGKVRSSIHI